MACGVSIDIYSSSRVQISNQKFFKNSCAVDIGHRNLMRSFVGLCIGGWVFIVGYHDASLHKLSNDMSHDHIVLLVFP